MITAKHRAGLTGGLAGQQRHCRLCVPLFFPVFSLRSPNRSFGCFFCFGVPACRPCACCGGAARDRRASCRRPAAQLATAPPSRNFVPSAPGRRSPRCAALLTSSPRRARVLRASDAAVMPCAWRASPLLLALLLLLLRPLPPASAQFASVSPFEPRRVTVSRAGYLRPSAPATRPGVAALLLGTALLLGQRAAGQFVTVAPFVRPPSFAPPGSAAPTGASVSLF